MQQRMLTSALRPSREEQSETLSARFGAAHWYKEVDSYDWGGWGIAENGRFLRGIYRGDYHADVESYGDPQPCEQGLRIESAEQWLREHGFDPGMSDAFISEVGPSTAMMRAAASVTPPHRIRRGPDSSDGPGFLRRRPLCVSRHARRYPRSNWVGTPG
jgi:hypothetical protein